ncbi:hypothetical protein JXB22_00215 [candidate division WOR-3 bacterium]|nr:hypothetical protein [candidate division WOR-3 bacterium]
MTEKDKKRENEIKEEKEHYTPSPYNYCDYRCDRCEHQKTCKVYKDEQERLIEHYVKGEDPHDPDVFMNDMKDIFDRTREMIMNIAQEEGFDLDSIEDVEVPHVDPKQYVLYCLAREYADEAHVFLKQLQQDGITEEAEDAFDDLMWYHTLIMAKAGRLVSTFEDDLRDEKMQEIEEKGTLSVIDKCIRVSRSALETMLSELPEYLQTIAELMDLLKRTEQQINKDIRQKVGS